MADVMDESIEKAIKDDQLIKLISSFDLTQRLSEVQKNALLNGIRDCVREKVRLSSEVAKLKIINQELLQRIDQFNHQHDGCLLKPQADVLRQEKAKALAAQRAAEAKAAEAERQRDVRSDISPENLQALRDQLVALRLRADGLQALRDQLAAALAAQRTAEAKAAEAERQRDARPNISIAQFDDLNTRLARAERVAREAIEKERAEREKAEKALREKAEKERIAREAMEKEKAEREKVEKERIVRETMEKERAEREKAEKALRERTEAAERIAREAVVASKVDADARILFGYHQRKTTMLFGKTFSELMSKLSPEERETLKKSVLAMENDPNEKEMLKRRYKDAGYPI